MAITISSRPRSYVYTNSGSPGTQVFSNWNAGWNPIVYEFAVPTAADRLSSLFINIYEVGSDTLLSSITIRPFRTGNLIFDVAPFVRAYLFSAYETDFTTADNCSDAGNSINFYITYTQIFDSGAAQIFNSDQSKPITATCSAMQFGDSNNGNMLPYMSFNSDLPEAQKMKFLSAFERPVMWAGYPFSLSFIYNQDMIGVQAIKTEDYLDVNESQLSTSDFNLDATKIGKVNYLKVREPSSSLARFVRVSLSTGSAIADYYVDPGYVDVGYVQIQ